MIALTLIQVSASYSPTGTGAGQLSARNGLDDFAGSDVPQTITSLEQVRIAPLHQSPHSCSFLGFNTTQPWPVNFA